MRIWSYDLEEDWSMRTFSSSSIFTFTANRPLIILLKRFICSRTVVPSFMCNLYYSLWVELVGYDFNMYDVSSCDHKPVVVDLFMILYTISSANHSWTVPAVLLPILIFHDCRILFFPSKALLNQYCFNPLLPYFKSYLCYWISPSYTRIGDPNLFNIVSCWLAE